MKLRNVRIATRLYLLVVGFIAGCILLSVVMKNTLDELKIGGPIFNTIAQDKDLVADILPPPEYIIESYLVVLQAVSEQDKARLDQLISRFKKLKEDYESRRSYWLKELEAGRAKDILSSEAYAPASRFYEIAEKELFTAIVARNTIKVRSILDGELKTKYEEHRQAIDKLVQIASEHSNSNEKMAAQIVQKRLWYLVVISLAIIACLTALCLYIIRTITGPLRTAYAVTSQIAKGDLSVTVDKVGNDELAHMGASMHEMVTNLRQITGSISTSASTLAGSSQKLSAASDELTKGSTQLSSEADQVVTAMTEVSQTIVDVAKNASAASEASKNASETALKGKQQVDKTTEDMTKISQIVQDAASTIEGLGQKSAQIGEIVSVINGIADQTNLLALNAAIEAARAGEQGRGFAVVADEVRKLAERTVQSTNDIAERIKSIQQASTDAVDVMKKGRDEVQKGVILAKETSASIETIVVASTSAMDMVRQIAAATEQQSSAAEQVTRNMENVAAIVRQTSTSSEEIKTSSAELSQLASGLTETAAWFKQ